MGAGDPLGSRVVRCPGHPCRPAASLAIGVENVTDRATPGCVTAYVTVVLPGRAVRRGASGGLSCCWFRGQAAQGEPPPRFIVWPANRPGPAMLTLDARRRVGLSARPGSNRHLPGSKPGALEVARSASCSRRPYTSPSPTSSEPGEAASSRFGPCDQDLLRHPFAC